MTGNMKRLRASLVAVAVAAAAVPFAMGHGTGAVEGAAAADAAMAGSGARALTAEVQAEQHASTRFTAAVDAAATTVPTQARALTTQASSNVYVPDVTGDTWDDAQTALTAAGLVPIRTFVSSLTTTAGRIVDTVPAANMVATAGDSVIVNESVGAPKTPESLGTVTTQAELEQAFDTIANDPLAASKVFQITIGDDFDITQRYDVDQDVELDLGGHTLSIVMPEPVGQVNVRELVAFRVQDSAVFTISGGTLEVLSTGMRTSASAIIVTGSTASTVLPARLEVNGATIVMDETAKGGFAIRNEAGTVNFNSGTIDCQGASTGIYNYEGETTFYSGTITHSSGCDISIYKQNYSGQGGVNSVNNGAHEGYGIQNAGGTVSILGGTITVTEPNRPQYLSASTGNLEYHLPVTIFGLNGVTSTPFPTTSLPYVTTNRQTQTMAIAVRNGAGANDLGTYNLNILGGTIISKNPVSPAVLSDAGVFTMAAPASITGARWGLEIDGGGSDATSRITGGTIRATGAAFITVPSSAGDSLTTAGNPGNFAIENETLYPGIAIYVTDDTREATLDITDGTFDGADVQEFSFPGATAKDVKRGYAVLIGRANESELRSSNSSVAIMGGEFHGYVAVAGFMRRTASQHEVEVTGGLFYNACWLNDTNLGLLIPSYVDGTDAAATTMFLTFLRNGYVTGNHSDSIGKVVYLDETAYVAEIQNNSSTVVTQYATLERAFRDAGVGDVVVLKRDVTITSPIVMSAHDVQLNLNGSKITFNIPGGGVGFDVDDVSHFTITDTQSGRDGEIIVNNGGIGIRNRGGSATSIIRGVFTLQESTSGGAVIENEGGTISITAGTYTVKGSNANAGYVIHNKASTATHESVVTISDGTFRTYSSTLPAILSEGGRVEFPKPSDSRDVSALVVGVRRAIEIHGGTLEILTGSVQTTESAAAATAIYVNDSVSDCTVLLKGGNFTGSRAVYFEPASSVAANITSIITISGGVYSGTVTGGYPVSVTPGIIDICGGTFYRYPRSSGGYEPDASAYIRLGYKTEAASDGIGREVVMDEDQVVARIDGVGFITLAEAFASLPSSGSQRTIVMEKDVVLTEAIQVNNVRAALNLNGHTITVSLNAATATTAATQCAFNVTGSAARLNITNPNTGGIATGQIIVNGAAHGVRITNRATFYLSAGIIDVRDASGGYAVMNDGGTANISGGALRASFSGASTRYDGLGPGALYNGINSLTQSSSTTVTGGEFTSASTSHYAVCTYGGSFSISGANTRFEGVRGALIAHGGAPGIVAGTFIADSLTGIALKVTDDGNTTRCAITGGTFRANRAVVLGTEVVGKSAVAATITATDNGTFYGAVEVDTGINATASAPITLTGGTFYTRDGMAGMYPNPGYVGAGYHAVQGDGVGVIIARDIDATNTAVTITGFSNCTYNGQPQIPSSNQIIVSVNGRQLTEGTDYTYSFLGDTTNAGTVTVVVTGKGKYTGSATATYEIKPKEINLTTVTLFPATYQYVPGGVTPTIQSIVDNAIIENGSAKILQAGIDYEITSVSGGDTAGTGEVVIQGIGNYNGVQRRQFTVEPRSLDPAVNSAITIADLPALVYTGNALYATSLQIRDGDAILNAATDYTVTYYPVNPVNVGTVTVTITGRGSYTGTAVTSFDIEPRDITGTGSGIIVAPIADQTYTGSAVVPTLSGGVPGVEVRFGNNTVLVEGTDYTVTYENNVDVGTNTAYAVVTGIGNFTGTQYALYSIVDPTATGARLMIDAIADQTWTGNSITPTMRVHIGTQELGSGMYDVTYMDNVDVGVAIVTVTLKADFPSSSNVQVAAGTVARAGFRIVSRSARDVQVTYTENVPYDGGHEVEVPVTVRDGSTTLVKDRDYELVFPNGRSTVGQHEMVVRFIGAYAGNERRLTFNIVRNIAGSNISMTPIPGQKWTGSSVEPVPTLVDTDTGVTLVKGIHYTLSYQNNVNVTAGDAKVIITGIGDYVGTSRTETFAIYGDISDASVKLVTAKAPSSYLISDVRVIHGGKTLTFNTEYYGGTPTYVGNVVEVTVIGTGLYSGSKTVRFRIDGTSPNYTVVELDPTDPGSGGGGGGGLGGNDEDLVAVPNLLTGMTGEQARQALLAMGFQCVVTYAASTSVSTGYVCLQSSAPGSLVARGSTITVTVSTGYGSGTTQQVTVPNVVGMTESGAKYVLEARGFTVTVVSMNSTTVPIGEVMGQSIAAGSSVGKGSNITITVCVGAGSGGGTVITMPDVQGKSEAAAEAQLTALGLLVRKNYASSSSVAQGLVMGQSVAAGSSISQGSTIWLTVSNGGVADDPGSGGNGTGGSGTGGNGTGGTNPTTPDEPDEPTTPSTDKVPVSTEAIPQKEGDTAQAVKRTYADGSSDIYITSFSTGQEAVGWQLVNGNYYFAYKNGKAVTGMLDYGGDVYLLGSDGTIQTGFQYDPATGDKIFLNDQHDGYYGVMKENTWLYVQSEWYHAAHDGTIETGTTRVDNLLYYFDDSGVMQTGWCYDQSRRVWLYASEQHDGTYGAIVTNSWIWDGGWYLSGSDGALQVGWVYDGTYGRWYYMNPGPEGSFGEMKTGWVMSAGTWYLLGDDGAMVTGWVYDPSADAWYYLAGNGAMQTGWFWADGGWYYANPSGVMQKGWNLIGGDWYVLNPGPNGILGRMLTGWYWDGAWYYLRNTGQMLANGYTADGFWMNWDGKLAS